MKKKYLISLFLMFNLLNVSAQDIIVSDTVNINEFYIDSSNTNNAVWQIGNTSKSFFDNEWCLVTDTTNMYDSLTDAIVNLRIIRSNEHGGFYLRFDHKMDADTNHAGGYLEFNIDNDSTYYHYNGTQYSTWNLIVDLENNYTGFSPYFYTDLGHKIDNWNFDYPMQNTICNNYNLSYVDTISNTTSINNQVHGFTGTYNDWNTFELFLFFQMGIKINDIKDTLNFKFHFVSDSLSNNKNGWAIKNIFSGECYDSGLDEYYSNHQIIAYPNPTNSNINVSIPNPTNSTVVVEIYNLLGELVQTQYHNGTNLSIKLNDFSNGTYIVKYKIDRQYIGYSKVTKQ